MSRRKVRQMGGWLRQNWLWQLGRALVAVWIGWAEGSAAWARDMAPAAPGVSSPPTLPIPWEWVYDLQEQARQRQCTLVGLLRSDPLPAPDPQWQVYTRLDLVATPQAGRLTSVLFAENTRTRALQVIYQASGSVYDPVEALDFAMILPLAWQGNTLLAREYEGWFQTDLSWDRAVVWPLPTGSTGIPPVQIWDPPPALGYAELLGWDPQARERVLFAVADSLGEMPRLVSVGPDRQVLLRAPAVALSPTPSSLQGWQEIRPKGGEPLCHQSRFGLEQGGENEKLN
ncbi:hypothetical protein [Synechococcus sp. JA-2-3B'a(2-13)]|uniref:hypothetical protein n=1 Tax=Synechococcus sp. (strain JA-2-3B'a(2-13)) TaxID=321332 RepID=UPI00164FB67E|nr:hypothetical protein [Synechococcus sp. JA-2-3B'a(2-13)]